jgi:hypothetical protein
MYATMITNKNILTCALLAELRHGVVSAASAGGGTFGAAAPAGCTIEQISSPGLCPLVPKKELWRIPLR